MKESFDDFEFSLGLLAGIRMNECSELEYNSHRLALGINAAVEKANQLHIPLSFSSLLERSTTSHWRAADLITLKGTLGIKFSREQEAENYILTQFPHLYGSRGEGRTLAGQFKSIGEAFLRAYTDPIARLEDLPLQECAYSNNLLELHKEYASEEVSDFG